MDKAQQDALKKAAGIEAAKLIENGMIAGLLMQQVRRRTGDGVQTLVGGIEVGHGRQQTPGVGVARVVEDLVDGACLHDLAREIGRASCRERV